MKKKILLLLTVLLSLVCYAACNDGDTSSGTTSVSSSETVSTSSVESESESTSESSSESSSDSKEESAVPEFPNNDFGKDNEASYPDAWN